MQLPKFVYAGAAALGLAVGIVGTLSYLEFHGIESKEHHTTLTEDDGHRMVIAVTYRDRLFSGKDITDEEIFIDYGNDGIVDVYTNFENHTEDGIPSYVSSYKEELVPKGERIYFDIRMTPEQQQNINERFASILQHSDLE